jgi:mannose-6-phosphate isomerase-like protein (cupin superfamily)
MDNKAPVLTLVAAIQRRLHERAATGDAIGQEAARVLALLDPLPEPVGAFTRSDHPSTRHIEAAFATGTEAAELLAAIRPVAFNLPWRYSYDKRDDAPGLEDNMAFAEIIGPEAPYKSARVCLGLTLIGPETFYPPHTHPAIELYYVVSGTATWIANGVPSRNSPGDFILHPSQVVHAMQTRQEPLLAVYSWSGEDVKTLSKYNRSELPRKSVGS